MVIKFSCICGNTDPSLVKYYDGCLGYEALICKCCGRYQDNSGIYETDEFSKQFIIPLKNDFKEHKRESDKKTIENIH